MRLSPPLKQGASLTRAFTLIELLVSMTVLVILVGLIGQMVNSATSVTVGNRERLDADSQARVVFDRMAYDFDKMLKRTDVDYLFAKIDGGSQSPSIGTAPNAPGGNDKMFFYSEAPAFFDGDPTKLSTRSSVALLGYRINPFFQLERLGKLLTWDGAQAAATPGGVMFLNPSQMTTPLDPSTLAGNWPNTIGAAGDNPPYSNTANDNGDYHVLAEQVCRLEICFQLTNGSYSTIPLAPVTSPNTLMNNLTAMAAPTAMADSGSGYMVGSRWYEPLDFRAFVCVSNSPGAAVWNPLGLQDVRGIVVALAILDGTSAKVVPSKSVTDSNQASNQSNDPTRQVPDLSGLIANLADATIKDFTGGGGSGDTTVPNLIATPNPRLMAEAWGNAVKSSNFSQNTGLPATGGGSGTHLPADVHSQQPIEELVRAIPTLNRTCSQKPGAGSPGLLAESGFCLHIFRRD